MSVWTPAFPFTAAETTGLLSAIGLINTLAVFAYSTALNRVSGVKYRKRAAAAFVAAWVAILMVVAAYVLHSYWGLTSTGALLVDAGLLLWVLSFPFVLAVIWYAARDSVGRGLRRAERDPGFVDLFGRADFGVPVVDQVLRRALEQRRSRDTRPRVTYPFLVIHDINAPGLRLAASFARAGIAAGEAVVYLTFSRPHGNIARLLFGRDVTADPTGHVWIVDCYAANYMPEAMRGAGRRVLFADPRDPGDVYLKYMRALTECRAAHTSVRSIYETLSDFIKIADADLVMQYLRRVVVLEEARHIRAVYLFWSEAIQGSVDQRYLRWFFSTTLELTVPETLTPPAQTSLRMSNVFADPVTVTAGPDLRLDEAAVFQPRLDRIEALAAILGRLRYEPEPHGFLAALGGPDHRRHVVNFLFFMTAIDHDTHRPDSRYEARIDGRTLHGSDLLYELAEQAKLADPRRFLAAAWERVTEPAVAEMFTAPNGRLPADLAGRAEIFRESAAQLRATAGGDALALLDHAAGRAGVLLEGLAGVKAFRDPIGKKAALLLKLLVAEGLFHPTDPERLEVAIDHVVMTMALRAGLVACGDPAARAAIGDGKPLDAFQMALLRETTAAAMRRLVATSGLPSGHVDDLIWAYGRAALRKSAPLEDAASITSGLDKQVRAEDERVRFVAFLNGIDGTGADRWPAAPTVRGPATRFF